jgi:hypothetical protein
LIWCLNINFAFYFYNTVPADYVEFLFPSGNKSSKLDQDYFALWILISLWPFHHQLVMAISTTAISLWVVDIAMFGE